MYSGLSYFNEANQNLDFQNSWEHFGDFEIVHDQTYNPNFGWEPKIDFYENFQETDSKIFEIYNNSDLALTSILKYGMIRMEDGNVVSKSWKSIKKTDHHDGFEFRKAMNASEINIGLFDDSFYDSSRFSSYFTIIEGRQPMEQNEILVDLGYLVKYDVEVGQTINITLAIGSTLNKYPIISDLQEVIIENQTITGIYIPNQKDYYIDLNHFSYVYDFTDFQNNITYEIPDDVIENSLIFSYNDFSEQQRDHIFIQLYTEVQNNIATREYLSSLRPYSGYLLTYERSNVEYQKLRSWKTYLSSKSYEIYLYLPVEVGYIDRIALSVQNSMSEFSESRFFLQFLNFPIIIFGILINQNLFKQNEIEFDKKILNFRSKGMPKKKIIIQELINIVLSGILASILGLIFGCATFYGYRSILGNLFSGDNTLANFPLITTPTVILSFILGIGVTFFSNLNRIKRISKSNYSKLITNISQNLENGQDTLHSQDQMEERSSNSKVSISPTLKIVVGVIPLALYFLLYISTIIRIPDNLLDLTNSAASNSDALLIFAFFGLGLIISGLVQFVAIEKTSTYQKYSKMIGRIFVEDLNPIVTHNLLANKKWSKILSYLSLFIAYLVCLNICFYTQLNFENLLENYQPGTNISDYFHDASILDLQGGFSLEFGKSGFFKMLYIDFVLIGIFLAIEMTLNIIIVVQENNQISQYLLNRGMKKNQILKMLLAQTTIIFSIASIIGISLGLLFGLAINKITMLLLVQETTEIPLNVNFPLMFEFWSIFAVIFAIFIIVCFLITLNTRGKYRNHYKIVSNSYLEQVQTK